MASAVPVRASSGAMRRYMFLTGVLLATTLAACDSSSSTSQTPGFGGSTTPGNGSGISAAAAAAKAHPCTVITQAQAETAWGGTLKPSKEKFDTAPLCYFGTAAEDHLLDNVQVIFQTTFVFDGTSKSTLPGNTVTAVSGLGDKAFYWNKGGIAGIDLAFEKGGVPVFISLRNHSFTDQQTEAAERTLADIVAAQI